MIMFFKVLWVNIIYNIPKINLQLMIVHLNLISKVEQFRYNIGYAS